MSIQAIGNWFYFVGQQWLGSLKIFLPKNFKLFALVTINAWWQAWKVVLKYFWWVFFVYPILSMVPFFSSPHYHFFLRELIFILITYLFYSAIRPSVMQKNMRYFFDYITHGLFFFLYFGVFSIFMGYFFALFSFLNIYFNSFLILDILLRAVTLFFSIIVQAGTTFAFFFFLDSSMSMKTCYKSIVRGLKMAFYGLPFSILVVLFVGCLAWILLIINTSVVQVQLVAPLVFVISNSLVYSLRLCILNTFYIKRAHEDYDLYFI